VEQVSTERNEKFKIKRDREALLQKINRLERVELSREEGRLRKGGPG